MLLGKRARCAAFIAVGIALMEACGARVETSASSAVASRSSPVLHFEETPLAAATFNDSIGVGVHLTYEGTPWDSDYAKWSPWLLGSPIKHVRDGFCNWGTASSFCTGTWIRRWKEIAAAGITTDVVTDPWMGWNADCNGTCFEGYAAALGVRPSSIEAYEGPNECDDDPDSCTRYGKRRVTAAYTIANWLPLLWGLRSPGIAIYGPAMAFPGGYARFRNVSQYMDYGSIHDFPGDNYPENDVVPEWQAAAANTSGTLPLVSTETGYNTDATFTNNGVSQRAQERYIPRILLTHLHYGIRRTYLYELFDFPAGRGTGQDFGLLDANYAPKPAWTRLMQLMRYFGDASASPREPLAYDIVGDSSGRLYHVLFQRSDGTYLLVIWLGTQLWNPTDHSDMPPESESITVTLPKVPRDAELTEFKDDGQMATIPEHAMKAAIPIDVRSLISVLRFRF